MTNSNDALRAALEPILNAIAKSGKVEAMDWHHITRAFTPSPVAGGDLREAVALEAYRAAVRWIAADSWDGCSECIKILQMARSLDDMEWTPDQHATALKRLYERAGHAALNQPAAPVEAVAYWYRHPTHTDEPFGTQPLTDADKAAGWTETPLYAHPPEPAASTVAQGEAK